MSEHQAVVTHVITIIVLDNGSVQGDLDETISLWPACATEGEATTIDGQARSILDQALRRMLIGDLERAAEPERLPSPKPEGGKADE